MTDLHIHALQENYRNGGTPGAVMADIRSRAEQERKRNIWIHLLNETEIQPYLDALTNKDPDSHPLWGIPFAIKDNIDLAGVPTTAGCREYRYQPVESATTVKKLIEAGAIPVGKTNLDQFATGLNGTRSPWGACANAFDAAQISGGSSSGSAVAVALGLASFSLGTDTAGSGRVPAGLNNLVGLKPSRGLLSNAGVVPACRTLDCVSIFALTADDANAVLEVSEGIDAKDTYTRENPFANRARHYGRWPGPARVGVIPPDQLEFFGDSGYAGAYQSTLRELKAQKFELNEIDYAPFAEVARLLYEGPWVAERYLATLPLVREQPEAMLAVIREIIEPGCEPRATDLFQARYRLQDLQRQCRRQLAGLDCLLTPTAPRSFTIAEMQADPVRKNSQLGHYTNFVNLLDLSAVAVPAGFTECGRPFGITLISDSFQDRKLLSLCNRIQSGLGLSPGAINMALPALQEQATAVRSHIAVAVCGAHLTGQPLNWQLSERGASLMQQTRTTPDYRLYALAGGPPFRPGLVRDAAKGAAIEVEVWSVPAGEFGSFVAGIPAPLGIGRVALEDGSECSGFICEPRGIEGAEEITHLGGWLRYLARH